MDFDHDEMQDCAVCGRTFHHSDFNDQGICQKCQEETTTKRSKKIKMGTHNGVTITDLRKEELKKKKAIEKARKVLDRALVKKEKADLAVKLARDALKIVGGNKK